MPFDSGRGWSLQVPLPQRSSMSFNFTSLNGEVMRIAEARPEMGEEERRVLARAAMRSHSSTWRAGSCSPWRT